MTFFRPLSTWNGSSPLARTGGDIFHGALTLDQLYSARPALGYGDYRSPVKGLYMCGSGTHPGGGVKYRRPRPQRGARGAARPCSGRHASADSSALIRVRSTTSTPSSPGVTASPNLAPYFTSVAK